MFSFLTNLFGRKPETQGPPENAVQVQVRVEVFFLHTLNLQVYALQSAAEKRLSPYATFYWRDEANPQGFGPFASISDATNHYDRLKVLMKHGTPVEGAEEPKRTPVIKVDFTSKKKMP